MSIGSNPFGSAPFAGGSVLEAVEPWEAPSGSSAFGGGTFGGFAFGASVVPTEPTPVHASVLEAVQAWFATQTSLQSLLSTPDLWEWEAPEGTRLPYATIFEVSDVPELTTGDPLLERVAVQISLHDRTGGRAKALGNAFKTALHRAPLTVMGRPVAHCLYSNALLTKAEGKGPQGKDCHMQVLEFEVMVARPSIDG